MREKEQSGDKSNKHNTPDFMEHHVYVLTRHVQLFVTPWTLAHQAPLSIEVSRQEHWTELPFPSQGIFPTQGRNPGLLHSHPQCRKAPSSPHHFQALLLYQLCVKVAQSCPTLCDTMDCIVHGIQLYQLQSINCSF